MGEIPTMPVLPEHDPARLLTPEQREWLSHCTIVKPGGGPIRFDPSAPTPEPTPDTYVPTVHEVETLYSMAYPYLDVTITTARFRRFLAAHDAQVAAKALRAWALDFRDRYPEGVFPKPTSEQYARVHEHLKAEGSAIDNYSGDLMRRAAACALRAADEIESEAPHA